MDNSLLIKHMDNFYQIRDDYVIRKSSEHENAKDFAVNLTERKFSFPIIHHAFSDSFDRLHDIMRPYTDEPEIKKETIGDESTEDDIEFNILEPYEYAFSHHKPISGRFLGLLNYWFELPKDQFKMLMDFTEVYFASAILLDDIQDCSDMRNAVPAVHCVYGIAPTMVSSYYAWFKCTADLIKVFPPEHALECLKLLFSSKQAVYHGTGLEIYWRDSQEAPSESEHFKILSQKAEAALHVYSKIMAILSTSSKRSLPLRSLIETMSSYLQIRNDYENLTCPHVEQSKGFCQDFTEGKHSLPFIYALEYYKNNNCLALKRILDQRTNDIELKRYGLSLIKQSGALEQTEQVMRQLEAKIAQEAKALGGNPYLKQALTCTSYDADVY